MPVCHSHSNSLSIEHISSPQQLIDGKVRVRCIGHSHLARRSQACNSCSFSEGDPEAHSWLQKVVWPCSSGCVAPSSHLLICMLDLRVDCFMLHTMPESFLGNCFIHYLNNVIVNIVRYHKTTHWLGWFCSILFFVIQEQHVCLPMQVGLQPIRKSKSAIVCHNKAAMAASLHPSNPEQVQERYLSHLHSCGSGSRQPGSTNKCLCAGGL